MICICVCACLRVASRSPTPARGRECVGCIAARGWGSFIPPGRFPLLIPGVLSWQEDFSCTGFSLLRPFCVCPSNDFDFSLFLFLHVGGILRFFFLSFHSYMLVEFFNAGEVRCKRIGKRIILWKVCDSQLYLLYIFFRVLLAVLFGYFYVIFILG